MMMLCVFIFRIEAHAQFVETPYISWSPDGTMLTVAQGTSVTILDVVTLSPLNTINGLNEQDVDPAWSPDGTMLAFVDIADVQVWDFPWDSTNASLISTYQYYADLNPPEPTVSISSIAWDPSGTQIATAIRIVLDIWQPTTTTGVRLERLMGEWNAINDIEWFADGRFAIGSSDAFVSIFDTNTWEIITNYLAIASTDVIRPGVWAIAVSPDGDQMVIGSQNGIMQIWDDTRTTETLAGSPSLYLGNRVDTHADMVLSLSWSPDGNFIASSGRDGTVRIYDAINGEQLQIIELGAEVAVNSVAWSPDGTQLAYGTTDGNGVEIIPAPSLSNKSSENSLP